VIVGSGVDVIEIARIERSLRARPGRFAARVYSPREITHCAGGAGAATRFAVRFAAKEALMKALGTGWAQGVRWVDIECLPRERGRGGLELVLHGRVGEIAGSRGASRAHLATSRTRTHALAVVLLEGGPA